MIKIHISFWIAAGVFWALGFFSYFLMLIVAVSAHELSHILVAKAFGCRLSQLRLSALGEMAHIQNMDQLSAWKRATIIAAGPACNLALWLLFSSEIFGFYNLILFGFNLLPVFPLDGARLAQLWLGNLCGVLRANRRIILTGKIICMILMLLGVVQAILYAPNFTMLIMGFVLWRKNKSMQLDLSGEFYMAMLGKSSRILSVKNLYLNYNLTVSEAIERLTWDNILIINLPNGQIVSEPELIRHITKNNLDSGGDEPGF